MLFLLTCQKKIFLLACHLMTVFNNLSTNYCFTDLLTSDYFLLTSQQAHFVTL